MITMICRIIICGAIASSFATGTAGAIIFVVLLWGMLYIEHSVHMFLLRHGHTKRYSHLNEISFTRYIIEKINYKLSRIIKKKAH